VFDVCGGWDVEGGVIISVWSFKCVCRGVGRSSFDFSV
jgi:hypothetical protein